jgi:hypothetical protein
MPDRPQQFIVWTPRLLSLAFCGFLSLFAFDAFGSERALLAEIQDFVIHLAPAAVVAAVAVVAWRWPAFGAFAFIAAGTLYALSVGDRLSWILVVSGPAWVIGTLYLLSARQRTLAGSR